MLFEPGRRTVPAMLSMGASASWSAASLLMVPAFRRDESKAARRVGPGPAPPVDASRKAHSIPLTLSHTGPPISQVGPRPSRAGADGGVLARPDLARRASRSPEFPGT